MARDLSPAEAVVEPKEAAEHAGLTYVSDEKPGIRRRRSGKGFAYSGPGGSRIGDAASLKRIKGVGEGTAKKIVLALGKILIHQPVADDPTPAKKPGKGGALPPAPVIAPGLDEDTDAAVKVVCQLQMVEADVALQAVQRAFSELSAKSSARPSVQDVVRRAMKYAE